MNCSGKTKIIERQEAIRPRQGAALEVVRVKLTDYARAALGVQVHSIPAATGVSSESGVKPQGSIRAVG